MATQADVKTEASQFTPAPWGYMRRPDGTMVVLTREPSGGARKHIAEMSWADSEGGEPDARLIAAAPELYEALKPIANMCRVLETRSLLTFGKIVGDREVLCESSGEAGQAVLRMGDFRRAAEALAKARGGR